MVFNTTFNTISVILLQSFLLLEETGVPGENHRPVARHYQTLSHNVEPSTPRMSGFHTHKFSGDTALIAEVVVNPTTRQSRP